MRFLLLFSLFFLGCTTVRQQAELSTRYMYDMKIKVNGISGTGVVVVPRSGRYDFKIESRGDLNFFAVETCHRYDGREKAWEKGWFKSHKKVEFSVVPKPQESSGLCPYELKAFAVNGQHSWGLVVPELAAQKLPATAHCNGRSYRGNGVSVCHAKVGLKQAIEFSEDTTVKTTCEEPKKRGHSWHYSVPPSECIYIFRTDKKKHTHVVVPFEQMLLREDP
jgi:hypothetical protein